MSKGMLYIISAPSGGGKTSLVRALLTREENLLISVSHTTRSPRPGEVDGVNYHFVSKQDFEQLQQSNVFLESAVVFGHHYGTSRDWVNAQIQLGHDVILEIDWQGAQQIKQCFENCLSIFILPPSLAALRQRLCERAQDSESVIEKRMQQAQSEISHYHEFDYLLINDKFENAVNDLVAIVHSQRLQRQRQQERHQDLLAKLLG